MQNAFGSALRDWRSKRRMSQLDLGLAANVSARHISFLETGRARPSQPMVKLLSEQLDLPHSARNAFLNAAGFAPAYRRRALSEKEMAPVHAAVDWMLTRHEPFPAFAIDKHWRITDTNRPAAAMLQAAGIGTGDSLLDAMLEGGGLPALIENWPETARHILARLQTESSHLGGDAVLDAAIKGLTEQVGSAKDGVTGTLPPVISTRYRQGDTVLAFFSTIAQFGAPEDMTLAELRIEMLFPADEATRQILMAAAGS